MKLSVLIAGLATVASLAEAGTCAAHLAQPRVFTCKYTLMLGVFTVHSVECAVGAGSLVFGQVV